jgi:hypothetical protein
MEGPELPEVAGKDPAITVGDDELGILRVTGGDLWKGCA